MRFFTSVITLIVASALTVASTEVKTVNAHEQIYLKLSEDCRSEVDQNAYYNKCLGFADLNENTIKEFCDIAFSDDCIKFYKDPLATLPKCKDDPVMQKYAEYNKNTAVDYNKFYCEGPSEGKYCPTIELYLKSNNSGLYNYTLNCEYKVCLDNTIKIVELDKQYGAEYKELIFDDIKIDKAEHDRNDELFLLAFKDESCTSKMKDSNTSGASSVKAISSFISLGIVLLLYFVF